MVVVGLAIRLVVVVAFYNEQLSSQRDHFEFGWEVGRVAQSVAGLQFSPVWRHGPYRLVASGLCLAAGGSVQALWCVHAPSGPRPEYLVLQA